ncbi:fibronectin type III domain-containing protein [Saccharicrinis fermentans]|uniref:Fibronectin type-III domain-containing protein n=1 Tax=Saccharicrinis fermentans DSM 9555 = JCM 21142 TaxID=869213 RepID=W7YLQ1_9BACT|nr:hypothetical protein [Saccharicrinis fermentans]GAF03294.1 hypothetical protein JCM21142_41962 [Saccharicrinis fermentans DSM 9555 = JCM 21142]
MNKIQLFTILLFTLVMMSCSKDDDNEVQIGEITGGNITENHGTVLLQWNAYEGALAYYVFVGGQSISDIPYTGTQAVITEIEDNDIVEVKAYADSEASKLLAILQITYEEAPLVAPSSPTEATALSPEKTSVDIQFTYSGTCDGISIYAETRTGESVPLITIDDVTEGENNVRISSLEADTEYTLFLYAFNKRNEELVFSDAATVSFTTASEIVDLKIESYGYEESYGKGLRMKVLIVASDLFADQSDWTGYGDLVLEMYSSSEPDGDFKLAATDKYFYPDWEYSQLVDMIAYTKDMGWENGQTYYLQVVAKNKDGEILGQTVVQDMVYEEPVSNEIIPGKPEGVSLSLNENCVSISWDKASDAVKYWVYVASSKNMAYKSKVGEVSGTSIKDCDRGKNVKMYYQVVAISSTGNKSYSSVIDIWL